MEVQNRNTLLERIMRMLLIINFYISAIALFCSSQPLITHRGIHDSVPEPLRVKYYELNSPILNEAFMTLEDSLNRTINCSLDLFHLAKTEYSDTTWYIISSWNRVFQLNNTLDWDQNICLTKFNGTYVLFNSDIIGSVEIVDSSRFICDTLLRSVIKENYNGCYQDNTANSNESIHIHARYILSGVSLSLIKLTVLLPSTEEHDEKNEGLLSRFWNWIVSPFH